MPDKRGLSELHEALLSAQEAYRQADVEYSSAGRTRTDCLNRLNETQKAFDAAVAAMRDAAPRESDWSFSKRKAVGTSDA